MNIATNEELCMLHFAKQAHIKLETEHTTSSWGGTQRGRKESDSRERVEERRGRHMCKWGHRFSIAQPCSHHAVLQAAHAKSELTLYVMLGRWRAELCSESNAPLFNKTTTNLWRWNILDIYFDGIGCHQVNSVHPKCFDRFQGYWSILMKVGAKYFDKQNAVIQN